MVWSTDIASAATRALDEVERQLRNEIPTAELLDSTVDLSWSLTGPARWHFHIEAERRELTSAGVTLEVRLYGRRWLRTVSRRRMIDVDVPATSG